MLFSLFLTLFHCMDWMIAEAEESFKKFPYRIKKPGFIVMNRKKFEYYLKDSPLLLSVENTPSFVAHLPDGDLVCLCPEIIDNITKSKNGYYKKRFVQAITMHELFHIRNMHFALTEKEALLSEEEVHE